MFNSFECQNPYQCKRDCENRHVGCHGKCEQYKKFREWNEELNAKKRQEALVNRFTVDSVICSVNRIRRKDR